MKEQVKEMEFEKVLKGRRSIRKYSDRKVSKEALETLIQAAIEAPSWKNSQSARFYVVTQPELLMELKQKGLPERNMAKCIDAPCLIVACYKPGLSGIGDPGLYANELADQWSMFDLGLAVENLCLQAFDLGLGTLIMGIRQEKEISELLNIPDDLVIAAVISLGYPDQDPVRPKRHEVNDAAVFME